MSRAATPGLPPSSTSATIVLLGLRLAAAVRRTAPPDVPALFGSRPAVVVVVAWTAWAFVRAPG